MNGHVFNCIAMINQYRLAIAVAMVGFWLSPAPSTAQASAIEHYWEALTDAPTLAASMMVPLPDTSNPRVREITGGLQRLRKYEFTLDRTDALLAVKQLEHAVRLDPADAWAHYALGTALARGSDMRMRPYAQRSSYKPGIYSMAALRAPKELQRALELDPKFDLAALELAQVALDLTDTNLMAKALELLDETRRRNNAVAIFMSARLEGRLGNTSRAIQLGDQAKALGVDASIVALERVLALVRMKASEDLIGEAYFAGVESLTEAGAERYFAGAVQLASKPEVDAWVRAGLNQKREWLRRFWAKRAAIAGQPAARQISALYQKYNRAYDIRGMTVIGGRPEEQKKPALLGMIFPRVVIGDTLCIAKPGAPCPIGSNVEARRLKAAYLDFDGWFAKPVLMAWEALQFRTGPDGGSQVVGAVQVVAESVRGLADQNGTVDVNLTISVTDTMADSIAHASTRVQFPLAAVDPSAGVLLGVSVAAPPVRHAIVRVGIENASRSSGAVAKGDIDVMRFDPDSLTMSDVVLSPSEGNAASFERGAIHVSLAPGHIYRSADVPTLYYEIYGLPDQATFSTRIEIEAVESNVIAGIRKLLGRRPTAFAISFKDVSSSSPIYGTQQIRQLHLNNLKAGYYLTRVTVTDERGRVTTRERFFEVRE